MEAGATQVSGGWLATRGGRFALLLVMLTGVIFFLYWQALLRPGATGLDAWFQVLGLMLVAALITPLKYRRFGQPPVRGLWLWTFAAPLIVLFPLWHWGRVAEALDRHPTPELLSSYAAAATLLTAAYVIWIVAYPFEEVFGLERKKPKVASKLSFAGGAAALVLLVAVRAFVLARPAAVPPLAQAKALDHWAAVAGILVCVLLFAKFATPLIIVTDGLRKPFPGFSPRSPLAGGKIPRSSLVGYVVLVAVFVGFALIPRHPYIGCAIVLIPFPLYWAWALITGIYKWYEEPRKGL